LDFDQPGLVLGSRSGVGAGVGVVAHQPGLHWLGSPAPGGQVAGFPGHRLLGGRAGGHRSLVLPLLFGAQFWQHAHPSGRDSNLPERHGADSDPKRNVDPHPRPVGVLRRPRLPLGKPAVRAARGVSAVGVAALRERLHQPRVFRRKNQCGGLQSVVYAGPPPCPHPRGAEFQRAPAPLGRAPHPRLVLKRFRP
jgi:hypothetical protein